MSHYLMGDMNIIIDTKKCCKTQQEFMLLDTIKKNLEFRYVTTLGTSMQALYWLILIPIDKYQTSVIIDKTYPYFM